MEPIWGKKVKIELVGLDENAYFLMAKFSQAARRQGWTRDEIDTVLGEAKSNDYDHLLSVLIANTDSPEQ